MRRQETVDANLDLAERLWQVRKKMRAAWAIFAALPPPERTRVNAKDGTNLRSLAPCAVKPLSRGWCQLARHNRPPDVPTIVVGDFVGERSGQCFFIGFEPNVLRRTIPGVPHQQVQARSGSWSSSQSPGRNRRARLVRLSSQLGDSAGVGAEPLRDLALKQAQLQPAPAEVVTEGPQHPRIRCRERFLSSQGDTERGERNSEGRSRPTA